VNRKEENKNYVYSILTVGVTALLVLYGLLRDESPVGYGDLIMVFIATIGFILSLVGPFRTKAPHNRIIYIICAATCLYIGAVAVVRMSLGGIGGTL